MSTETLTDTPTFKKDDLAKQTTAYKVMAIFVVLFVIFAVLAVSNHQVGLRIIFTVLAGVSALLSLVGMLMLEDDTKNLLKQLILNAPLREKVEEAQASLAPVFRPHITYFMSRQGSATEELAREWELLIRRVTATENLLATLTDPEGAAIQGILEPSLKNKECNLRFTNQRNALQGVLNEAKELALQLENFDDRISIRLLDRSTGT